MTRRSRPKMNEITRIFVVKALMEADKRFNPNHGPDGKFTSGSGTSAGVDKSGKSDIIDDNRIIVGKSLGASGKNYPVKLPTGNHAKLAEGTEITGIKTIAGKGTATPIRVAGLLENNYGIKAGEWKKVRGTGFIKAGGSVRKAELHWYEAEDIRVEMKVKRYYDES